jgi:isoleucyl-tRNA synthetase
MTRLLSPFLSFTGNEAWQSLHNIEATSPNAPTIFEETAHTLPEVRDSQALMSKWKILREVRAEVMRSIEVEREAGRVGSSLQAAITLHAGRDMAAMLESLGDGLKFVMITSEANVIHDDHLDPNDFAVSVTPLSHAKCGRCWHWRSDVGVDPSHPEICGRCVSNLYGLGEPRHVA